MTKSEQKLRERLREMVARWRDAYNDAELADYNQCANEIEDLLKEIAPVDPFAPSTEEPTVDSSGWVEVKKYPGSIFTGSYCRLNGVYTYALDYTAKHSGVARHWLIPRPTIEGTTNA